MIDVDRADLELKGECFDSAKINGKQHLNKHTAVFLGFFFQKFGISNVEYTRLNASILKLVQEMLKFRELFLTRSCHQRVCPSLLP